MEQQPTPHTEKMVISDLVIVYCGFKIYLGVQESRDKWKIVLKNGLELEILRTQTEDGKVMERPVPAPIFPHQGPCKRLPITNFNVVIDVSTNEQIVPFYAGITRTSGLIIPGL